MRIVTLGTSAGKPTPQRSASAMGLEYEGQVLLFDCGEGTQVQLARSSLRFGAMNAIFITHLHGDHVYGLQGLLATMSLSERSSVLKLFGPKGLRKYLKVLHELRSLWVQFPLEVIEIEKAGLLLDTEDYQVWTEPLAHLIECWGFVFREKPRAGIFDAEKANLLEIPFGPLRGKLVKGESITLDDGRKITPEEVVGPKRTGRSVAYCLDTKPCPGDLSLAKNVDLLVHEATFDETYRPEMERYGHSTAAQAAEVAREAGAKKLILTHISPRYPNPSFLHHEAREVFPNSEMAFDLREYKI